ncbi:hypothetical protein ASG41_05420 [Modestobacter sp. Leaf380]|nr:hypothetical protein ASG41_05420 [Modestobacter sp. Leaf380]
MSAAAAGALAVSGVVLVATPAEAGPSTRGCENRVNASIDKLLTCVTAAGVTEHLAAFQAAADANGGNRASGSTGYAASADHVDATLTAAGYDVVRQSFEFPFFEQTSAAGFAQVAPEAATYAEGTDFAVATFSGSGDVTAVAQAVDTDFTPTATSTSGCEAADFAGFTAGSIALVQRGSCDFAVKSANAEAAGAAGVVIVNRGTSDDGGLISPTLGAPGVGIPVVGTTSALGSTLAGDTLALTVDAVSEVRTTENLTAELPGRVDDGVVVVGGHLDSVPEGPGINDNGSGSATILEVAQNLARTQLEHPVRFAFWGAEEFGLLGSQAYVDSLTDAELARIGSYLNFDMLGSPNHANFVYDSDASTFPAPEGYVSAESGAIEATFEAFYDSRGIAYEDTEFDGRSDYQAFADAGIPSGGLFSGAEDVKTPEQAARYGGTAGVAYDACYHQACDDLDNVSQLALDQNSDAVAYAVLTIADAGTGPGQGNG